MTESAEQPGMDERDIGRGRLASQSSHVSGKDRKAQAKIGIGVVGLGMAALSGHLPVIADSDTFQLVSVCDRDPSRLEYAIKRWPVRYASTHLNETLAAPGLDALIVATPPNSHLMIAQAAISKGKHLLVEKPMAPTIEESKAIVEIGRQNRVGVFVGYEKRFHPTLQRVRLLLRDHTIGTPHYCGVHWASNAKLDPAELVPEGFLPGYEWRWRDLSVGGGIVQDHLPHYVDLFQYWLGAAPVAVYSETINVARDLLGWSPDQSVWEDHGIALVRFANGFLLRFETGTVGRSLSPLWSQGSGIGEWTEYGYILGTHGQIVFDLLPWDSSENGRVAVWQLKSAIHNRIGWSYVEQTEPKRREGSPSGAAHTMFSAQLEEFGRAIQDGASECATGEDGVIGIAAVEAAYRSARARREFPVSWA